MNAENQPEKVAHVDIYGRQYAIRADETEAYVAELAQSVHDKMVELEQNTGTVDTIRLAILTALNLADELAKTKQRLKQQQHETQSHLDRLNELLEPVVAQAHPKSPA